MPALSYVTIDMPDRRMDVALPSGVPVAELLPTLVRAGGPDGSGVLPAGWCLRRMDGAALAASRSLADHEVRDGEVLVLAETVVDWPPPVVDDIAVSIVGDAHPGRWSAVESRRAGLLAAGLVAILAGLGTWRAGTLLGAMVALAIAAGLLVMAVARADADFATIGLPLVAFGSVTVAGTGFRSVAEAAAATAGYASIALATRAAGRADLVAVLAGSTGLIGAAAVGAASDRTAAAVTLIGYAVLIALTAPSLAVRAGGLNAADRSGVPDPERVAGAAARTDMVLSGLIWASGLAAGAGAGLLAGRPGLPSLVLVVAAFLVLAVRSRLFRRPAHRFGLLSAAGAVAIPAFAVLAWRGELAWPVLAAPVAVLLVSRVERSPYLARVAEAVEIGAVAVMVPAICWTAGLFGTGQ